MILIWQSSPPLSDGFLVPLPAVLVAQAAPAASGMMREFEQYGFKFGPSVLNLLGAIVILIIGWIVAVVAAKIVRNLLKRTDVDNRVVGWVRGTQQGPQPNVEKWASLIVFWLILIIAIVAFLSALQLTAVAEPLKNFLNQIFLYLPKLGAAVILLGVAWILATIAKNVVIRSSQSFGLDRGLGQEEESTPPENQFLLSETLGKALYWFVFLFFLPLILGVLDLQGPLRPVQNLLDELLAALPRILKALLIGGIGWFIARTVRTIVTNLLSATGTDRLGTKLGLSRPAAGQSLSGLLGTVVYVLILLPTAIAALDALEIQAISAPAVSMLNQMLNAIPQIFTAAIVLAIAYVVSQFVAELVKNLLAGIGFNNLFVWLGLAATPEEPTTTAAEPATTSRNWTPSEVIAVAAQVGIMLFAIVAATNILNIPALTQITAGLLVIFGQILVGLSIFAVGLYLANLAFSLITRSGSKEARFLGQAARITIIALVAAMALQQMGIASNIINLALGLLLGAIAVAIALAFGLGGREIAAEKIREWLSSFRQD
jgi:hypothetical protein